MGEFEQLVLLALVRRGNDAYGMTVRLEIERQTGRDVSIGAVYTTLDRLERKGFVSHRMGSPTAKRGGRAKKFYRVEPAGARALVESRQAVGAMWEGVEAAALPGHDGGDAS